MNSQLQSRSGELKEKERELGEVRLKLEGEVASLQQQLLVKGEELQAAQNNITEVYTSIFLLSVAYCIFLYICIISVLIHVHIHVDVILAC